MRKLPSGRRSKWISLTGLVFVLCLAAIVWTIARTDPLGEGSLSLGQDDTRSGMTADVGTRWVYGYNLAVNHGEEPVRLVRAELLPSSSSNQTVIVSTRVDDQLPRPGVDAWPGQYANPSDTKPVEGYVVPPGGEVGILFVFEPTKPGRTEWTTTRVTYKEGSRTRVAEVGNGLVVCAPRNLNRTCERSKKTPGS